VFPSRFRAQPHGTPSANRPSIAHRRSGLLPCTARCRDRQRIRRGARGAAPLPRPSFPICCGHWRHHRCPTSAAQSRWEQRAPPPVETYPQPGGRGQKRKLRDTTATLSSRRSVRRSGTESSQTLCWRRQSRAKRRVALVSADRSPVGRRSPDRYCGSGWSGPRKPDCSNSLT